MVDVPRRSDEDPCRPLYVANINHGDKTPVLADGGQEGIKQGNPEKKWSLYGVGSIVLLSLHGTVISVVLRFSRIAKGPSYIPSVAVMLTELVKLCICLLFVGLYRDSKTMDSSTEAESNAKPWGACRTFVTDALPMALPASLFVMQQVLLVWSATYLDAVTYQIFNQAFKLIFTAVFARLMLDKKLKVNQWLSILLLVLGVATISLYSNLSSTTGKTSTVQSRHWYMATCACSLAGLSSAFAGTYFERYLKGHLAGDLITRNIQLGMFAVPLSALYSYIRDGETIQASGLLTGFTSAAWAVVVLQVLGGFIVATVIKYCDNILKNFALVGSVILTVVISIPLFDQWPSTQFLGGISLVLVSMILYSGNLNLCDWPYRLAKNTSECFH